MGDPECEVPLKVPEWLLLEATEEGDDGLAVITSMVGGQGDRLAGFKPGAATPRWVRTIPPIEPLRAQGNSLNSSHVSLAGGRVVATYDDISGKSHLVALDAKTGDQRWDVVTSHRGSFSLSPTRVYELDSPRLDVRDAATGKLLGGVGAPDRKSSIH